MRSSSSSLFVWKHSITCVHVFSFFSFFVHFFCYFIHLPCDQWIKIMRNICNREWNRSSQALSLKAFTAPRVACSNWITGSAEQMNINIIQTIKVSNVSNSSYIKINIANKTFKRTERTEVCIGGKIIPWIWYTLSAVGQRELFLNNWLSTCACNLRNCSCIMRN